MDTQHENTSQKITLNLDEFDIDAFDIKPVTKGLGFHNNSSAGVKPRLNRNPQANKPSQRQTTKTMTSPVKHLQSTPQTVSDPSLMSGIEALYGNDIHEKRPKVKKKPQTKKELAEASLAEQALSYFLDMSLVIGITSLLFTSFFMFAFRRFEGSMMIRFLGDSLPFIAVLASLIYLTYFSLLEPVGTVGKKLVGIGTFMVGSHQRSSIKASFNRALISLLSLPLLGIPLILDFHGKLSDTKVLKLK